MFVLGSIHRLRETLWPSSSRLAPRTLSSLDEILFGAAGRVTRRDPGQLRSRSGQQWPTFWSWHHQKDFIRANVGRKPSHCSASAAHNIVKTFAVRAVAAVFVCGHFALIFALMLGLFHYLNDTILHPE